MFSKNSKKEKGDYSFELITGLLDSCGKLFIPFWGCGGFIARSIMITDIARIAKGTDP